MQRRRREADRRRPPVAGVVRHGVGDHERRPAQVRHAPAQPPQRRPQRTRCSRRSGVRGPRRRHLDGRTRRGDRREVPRTRRPHSQGDADRRIERLGAALRGRPVAVAPPTGRVGHRSEVRVAGHRREDGDVVHRADVPLDRRRRQHRRVVRHRGRAASGRRDDRRGQPRRPGAGRAVGRQDRRPGAPRPQLGHPHRAARRSAPHPVPHRRQPGRGVLAAAVGAQRARSAG